MGKCKEYWKPVKGFEGLYEVSNYGRVKSLIYQGTPREHILKPGDNRGYKTVCLSKDKNHYCVLIHKIEILVFIPNPDNKPCVDHKDTDRSNNFIWINEDGSVDLEKSNLRWVSHKENMNNPLTREKLSGENNPFYSKNHTEETRCRISEAHKGKHFSDEVNKKKGRAGRYNELSACSKKVFQYTLNWEFIQKWPSTIEIKRQLGIPQGSISNCCLGKQKTAGGFKWTYKKKED